MSIPLNLVDAKYELESCERDMQDGFQKLANAVNRIKEERLYLGAGFDSFEEYCQTRWNWSRQYGYKIAEASVLISSLPVECKPMVYTERVARALKAVPEPERAEVLREVAETGPVTARAITEAAKKPEKAKPAPATIVNLDKMGYPIPDEIWEDWQRAEEFKATLRELQQIKLDVAQGLKDGDYVLYAEVNNGALATLQNSYRDLETILPYAVCTSCQGRQRDNCLLCRRRGFLSKFKYNTVVPENLRKIREALCKH